VDHPSTAALARGAFDYHAGDVGCGRPMIGHYFENIPTSEAATRAEGSILARQSLSRTVWGWPQAARR
jgi:hypothetical protein